MPVFAGTDVGVVRFGRGEEVVLGCGRVTLLRRIGEELFAAAATGLYRSADGGRSWADLEVPTEGVHSVAASPGGDELYAGTDGVRLYRTAAGTETWREVATERDLPESDEWETPPHHPTPRIRTVATHPDDPAWLLVGVEVGGIYVSGDRGGSWESRREGVHDDAHHVLVESPSTSVVSTGTGLYRTADGGRSWKRLDGAVPHRYLSESIGFDDALYAGIARGPPGEWDGPDGADGLLLRFDGDDLEGERLAYPGEPDEVVTAWTVAGRTLLAGTNEGTLLEHTDDGFRAVGSVGTRIRSLASLPSESSPRTD